VTDTTDAEAGNWIDWDRTVCLCDSGRPGYLAATIVAVDGSPDLVLVYRRGIGDPAFTVDRTCRDASHEQLGPLPPQWAARAALTLSRCGRTTLGERPCRVYVSRPGEACGWHRRNKSTA
jgi:hypothetical protein